MNNIRPVSDLRNKFPEIEKQVIESKQPVFLTKNGYGSMVLLSLEQYYSLTRDIEIKLDEADKVAEENNIRYGGKEIFTRARERINGKERL